MPQAIRGPKVCSNGAYCHLHHSQSTLRLAMNLEFHANTKHIDIKYHYTREQILLQSIRLRLINTHDQIADILTEPLSPYQFRRLHATNFHPSSSEI